MHRTTTTTNAGASKGVRDTGRTTAPSHSSTATAHIPNDVVVLFGASSVGKSTIIKALTSREPERQETGGDRFTDKWFVEEFFEKKHTGATDDEYQFLKKVLKPDERNMHIAAAVFCPPDKPINFLPDVSEADQEKARAIAKKLMPEADKFAREIGNLDKQMLDHVLALSRDGKPAVLDMLDGVDLIERHPLSSFTTVKKVLVYCPFEEIVNRMDKRNREALASGKMQEIRIGRFPLRQFADLFGPRQPSQDKAQVVTRLTKKTVIDTFDAAITLFDRYPKHGMDAGMIEHEEKNKQRMLSLRDADLKELLARLGFQENDLPDATVELVPRRAYDLTFNSSDPTLGTSPAERADTIASRIASWSKPTPLNTAYA